MKPNQLIAIMFFGTIFFLIFIDIISLAFFGADGTISVLLNVWAFKAHPLLMLGVGIIIGGLITHFFAWAPKDEQIKHGQ